ncbi:MAG: putative metal-binding motif-containing protein [archaeon]
MVSWWKTFLLVLFAFSLLPAVHANVMGCNCVLGQNLYNGFNAECFNANPDAPYCQFRGAYQSVYSCDYPITGGNCIFYPDWHMYICNDYFPYYCDIVQIPCGTCVGTSCEYTCPIVRSCADGNTIRITHQHTGEECGQCVSGYVEDIDCAPGSYCSGGTCVAGSPVSCPQPGDCLMMFVSNMKTRGNISEPGYAMGLDSADAICQGDAEAAGLPGEWIAFLSSSTRNIASLLGDATYKTVAGNNIADSKADLLDGDINTAIQGPWGNEYYSYYGNDVWSGTTYQGMNTGYNCQNWNNGLYSASGTEGYVSFAGEGGGWWVNLGESGCDYLLPLYCVQVCPDNDGDGEHSELCGGDDCNDDNPAINPAVSEQCGNDIDDDCDGLTDCVDDDCWGDRVYCKWVFLSTDTSLTGSLSGMALADQVCQNEANAAGIGISNNRQYVAWLSKSGVNAKDRIPDAEYILRDGTLIAYNKSDLIDGSIRNPLMKNATGAARSDTVWTGTVSSGVGTGGSDCTSWTSGGSTVSAYRGSSTSTSGSWTYAGTSYCNNQNAVYCFETGSCSAEVCTGGLDEDCDGQSDCADTDCCLNTACKDDLNCRMVFVSNATTMGFMITDDVSKGILLGTSAANAICTSEANAVGGIMANRAWKAYLSTSSGAPSVSGNKFIRPDNVIVSTSNTNFRTGTHAAPISKNAAGQTVTGDVWTGTTSSGTASAYRCTEWFGISQGLYGQSSASDAYWTQYSSSPYNCINTKHVYCVQTACGGSEICGNGIDDNCDGSTDCEDVSCCNTAYCSRSRQCRIAFVTSTQTTGLIQEPGYASGVASANAICQREAKAAGSLIQGYRAFGAYLVNVSQHPGISLNLQTRRYVRVDGSIITTNDIPWRNTANSINVAIQRRADNTALSTTVWTGMRSGNIVSSNPCSNWKNTSGNTYYGTSSSSTANVWGSSASASACSGAKSLYCVQLECTSSESCSDGIDNDCDGFIDCEDSDCSGSADCYYAFTTSTLTTGRIQFPGTQTGIASANALCQYEANLSSTTRGKAFVAWISTSGAAGPVQNARSVIANTSYFLVNRTRIANNTEDLTDGTIATTINLNSSGESQTGTSYVRTGTNRSGQVTSGYTCVDWTDNTSASGEAGIRISSGYQWTEFTTRPCSELQRLYCFQIACDADGVEDGGQCADGIDNDCDGLIDCQDTANCNGAGNCNERLAVNGCANNIDDDNDGYADCVDYDCFFSPSATTCVNSSVSGQGQNAVPGTNYYCSNVTANGSAQVGHCCQVNNAWNVSANQCTQTQGCYTFSGPCKIEPNNPFNPASSLYWFQIPDISGFCIAPAGPPYSLACTPVYWFGNWSYQYTPVVVV